MGALIRDVPAASGGEAAPDGDSEELRAAVALAAQEGMGPRALHELLEVYGTFRGILRAARRRDERLEKVVKPGLARKAGRVRPASPERMAWLGRSGIRVVARGLSGYPRRLLHLHDPPPVLYLRGPSPLPAGRVVAVVGTRRATEYGRRVARDLAMDLAGAGLCVVSGMARGIDARAHEGALDAGGRTLGVLGSGLEHRYPAANRKLYARMEEQGLLVSEFPPEQPPLSGLFPRRNRIIAALSTAVVVVQAGRRSGALNTTGHALDLGREVLAVPGPVGIPASEGVHGLLRDGAGVAARASDVLEALRMDEGPAGGGRADESPEGAPASCPAWNAARESLAGASRTAEELSEATGLPVPELLGRLTRWELDGRLETVTGGRYALAARHRGREGP